MGPASSVPGGDGGAWGSASAKPRSHYMSVPDLLPSAPVRPEALQAFPVTTELRVAWGDMDAFGHVNNVVYFRYFEIVRLRYFERIGFDLSRRHISPILGSISCRFRLPLKYPDTIVCGARVSEIGADRFTVDYAIFSREHQRLAAEGQSIVVAYDYAAAHKAALPAVLVRAIQDLERGAGGT
jgi:acyl-CoA thioester hydrolase